MGSKQDKDEGRTDYVSAGGYVHTNPAEAISASVGFEGISNTGVGCNQSPDNVSDNDSGSDSDSGDDK